VSDCVLDTDVVIAALDRRDAHHKAAVAALTAMIEGQTRLLLSLVNYAETLVRPAEQADALTVAQDALRVLGIRLVAPTAAIATDAARHRRLNVSLADGFALATAQAHSASVATFDRRVRRALPRIGLALAPELSQDRIAAMPSLTVYEKPTCTTCRNLRALLDERSVDFDSVDYHVTGIEEAELRELLRKLGTGPRGILRAREPLVKELGLDAPEVSDEQLIAQMVAYPQLVQRPIVVRGDRAVLARPVERALELL
jgi:arsenate reductase